MGNLFDEAVEEGKNEENATMQMCRRYIESLGVYREEMASAIGDNIGQLLKYRFDKGSDVEMILYEDTFFGRKYRVRNFSGGIYTDGLRIFKKSLRGRYSVGKREGKNSWNRYELYESDEMIDAIIEYFFWFFDDADYDNNYPCGISGAISRLNSGRTVYGIHSESLIAAIDSFLSVPAEVRVKEWIKKML